MSYVLRHNPEKYGLVLSADVATALQVGLRQDQYSAILKIDVKRASIDGIIFYIGNDKAWLVDWIPTQ